MNHQEEIRSLARISETFRKNKKPRSKWPVEFQLRVLKLIETGYSPKALSEKLNIPVQTYYHWRRVWKNAPKKNLNFVEIPVAGKFDKTSSNFNGTLSATNCVVILPNGIRLENLDFAIIEGLLHAV